jgi:hypothetical protein
MAEGKNLFTGDLDKVDQVPLEAPLAAERNACSYDIAFARAAEQAQQQGDAQAAAVYRFLGVVRNFAPSFDTPLEPYKARLVFDGKRTHIPSDRSAADILALEKFAPLAVDPVLRLDKALHPQFKAMVTL